MKRTPSTLALLATLSITTGLVACGDTPSAENCISESFDAQSSTRFLVGDTYYLPVLGSDDGCGELGWTLSEQPSGSEDVLVEGDDGIWRLTPTVPGSYGFTLEGGSDGGETMALEVVRADAKPFYNLNYYASHAAQLVEGELWVANVQVPTITRLDPETLAVLGEIPVGPWPVSLAWREGMDFVVVAQRGNDTLGLVDRASGRLIDAIWVGDEPANVVLSPAGDVAYVALKSENAVAVVDLERRVRTARVEVGTDPLAMTVSPDGATLWVASHRSGQPSRYPFEADLAENERDIAVVDTASAEVIDWWLDVGTTMTSLSYREQTDELYLSRLVNDTEASLGASDEPNFMYEVAVLDPATGEVLRSADVGRQDSSAGLAVSLHGLTFSDDRLWVVAESSNLALALDPDSLAELGRVEVDGRPRSIVSGAAGVFAHGSQGLSVTKISGLEQTEVAITATDNRPERVATGQAYFTGAGRQYAENWSCNSCHADGLSDTLVWNAGPFSGEKVSRPFYWLEGTYPLGWDGYLSSVDNYAFTVNTNVGIRPTTAEHRGLSAYLASIMPPPAENGYTRRDGSLSELAQKGKEIYEGKANCASCHPLPLTTTRAVLGQGVTEGTTDIPGLIGSYRLAVWLKRGEATTLHGAVDEVFAALGDPQLSDDEREALDRFMLELTARNFFVIGSSPRTGEGAAAIDEPMQLVFSHPVFDDAKNLAQVTLVDADGDEVEVARELSEDGRHLDLVPSAPLEHATTYTVRVDPSFESFDQGSLWVDEDAPAGWELEITTASAPALTLSGDYLWTVDMPTADVGAAQFDLENTIATSVSFTATQTAAGASMFLDYGEDLDLERVFVVDGDTLHSPALPIPIGPSFADSTGIEATLVDLDGDGSGDFAEGTLTISGPGFVESGVRWTLSRPTAAGECAEGSEGALPVEVSFDDSGAPVIDWGSDEPDALGVYFIGPDAQPPAGPGQPVTGGDVFWVVQLAAFPNGFAGPVTYGELPEGAVDETANVGGGEGAAALSAGQCVKVAVTTTSFMQGSTTFVVP